MCFSGLIPALSGSGKEDISRRFCGCSLSVGGGHNFKWFHLEHKPQWMYNKAVSVVIKPRGGIGGEFSGGLDLQTKIVSDSHGTLCANDMFLSASRQCAEIFCPRASRMYKSLHFFKSLGLSHWDRGAKPLLERYPTSDPVPHLHSNATQSHGKNV